MVGYVGVMAKQDGVDCLLRAVDCIVNRQRRDDVLFVLIGNGPEWEELVEYSKKLKLQKHLVFTGRNFYFKYFIGDLLLNTECRENRL